MLCPETYYRLKIASLSAKRITDHVSDLAGDIWHQECEHGVAHVTESYEVTDVAGIADLTDFTRGVN
jgi:hypothetical protein